MKMFILLVLYYIIQKKIKCFNLDRVCAVRWYIENFLSGWETFFFSFLGKKKRQKWNCLWSPEKPGRRWKAPSPVTTLLTFTAEYKKLSPQPFSSTDNIYPFWLISAAAAGLSLCFDFYSFNGIPSLSSTARVLFYIYFLIKRRMHRLTIFNKKKNCGKVYIIINKDERNLLILLNFVGCFRLQ